MAIPISGTAGSDFADFRRNGQGVTYDAGGGADLVLGSAYDDRIDGGSGTDALFGDAGRDTLRGGAGLDLVTGGSGDDTFLFVAGDLLTSRSVRNGALGLVDTVLDFRGAGLSGSGEQDLLRFEGFSAGATLRFDGYGLTRSQQFYQVVDAATPGAGGYILVNMADGTHQLTAADYLFAAPPPLANGAPTDVLLSAAGVAENAAAGTTVGTLSAADPDAGDTARFTLVNDAGGAFALASDGVTLVTTRAFDFEAGPTGYTVRVRATDAGGLSVERDLSVAVTNVDEAVVAGADSYAATEDTMLVVAAAQGVLANDAAPDGGKSAVAGSFATALGGSVTLAADGGFSYAPAANVSGQDSFTYTLRDADGSTATASVTLQVAAVNDAPVVVGDSYGTAEDTALMVPVAGGLLANDSDADGDALSAVLVTGPQHGTLSLDASGAFTYTPGANYSGADSFTYRAGDGSAQSGTTLVTLSVSPVNDAPVAAGDSYGTAEDTALVVPVAGGLLANDSDADGDALSAALVTGPQHGTLSLDASGAFAYTPGANYSGADGFTYRAGDGGAQSGITLVVISVSPVNDAPVAVADTASTDENTARSIAVLGNDGDVDGDALALLPFAAGARSTLGAALSVSNGQVVYDPTAATQLQALLGGQSAGDSFTYSVSDGHGGSSTASVTVTVTGVSDLNEGSTVTGTRDVITGNASNNIYAMQVDGNWGGSSTVNAYTGEYVSIAGRARSVDVYDGAGGNDTISGVGGGAALLYDTRAYPGVDTQGRAVGEVPMFTSIEFFSLGTGNDVLNLTSGPGGSTSYAANGVTLYGNVGSDVLWGGAGNEILVGDLNVFTTGTAGNDRLHGGAGNDALYGDGRSVGKAAILGDDVLDGGTGNDTLYGDSGIFGADFTGVRGADRFAFDGVGSGADSIGDYQPGVDHIVLSAGYGYASGAVALSHTANNGAGNAVVDLGHGDLITLVGVGTAALSAADFQFF